VRSFTRKLLAWYARHARDLPWRRTRDPYEVLVSEVMLQQTQVSRVEQYYPRFLERYPTLETLARAKPKAVREAWEGLGYYARARNLHQAARSVVKHHDAKLPDQPKELEKLPGIGRYTAGAVASFAYERAVPAVDTNVGRVIRRVFIGMRDTGYGMRPGRHPSRIPHLVSRSSPASPFSRQIWDIAATLVPRDGKRAWRFNQAMMELGALVCTARKPRCGVCPVRSGCKTGRRSMRDA
jgi:A/G-specific adenine glycosylase